MDFMTIGSVQYDHTVHAARCVAREICQTHRFPIDSNRHRATDEAFIGKTCDQRNRLIALRKC
jgi:hypothetical protein